MVKSSSIHVSKHVLKKLSSIYSSRVKISVWGMKGGLKMLSIFQLVMGHKFC